MDPTPAPRSPPATLNAVLMVLVPLLYGALCVGAFTMMGWETWLGPLAAPFAGVLGDWTVTATLADHTYRLDTAPMVLWQAPLALGLAATVARLPGSLPMLGQVWRGGGCAAALMLLGTVATALWALVWVMWLTSGLPEPSGRLDELFPMVLRKDGFGVWLAGLACIWAALTFPGSSQPGPLPRVLGGVALGGTLLAGGLAAWHGAWMINASDVPYLASTDCTRLHAGESCTPEVVVGRLDLDEEGQPDLEMFSAEEPGWMGWTASAGRLTAAPDATEAQTDLVAARPLVEVVRTYTVPVGNPSASPWFAPQPGDRWAFKRTVRSTRAAFLFGLVRTEKQAPKDSDLVIDIGPEERVLHGLHEVEMVLSGPSFPTSRVWIHHWNGGTFARTDDGFKRFLRLDDPVPEASAGRLLEDRAPRWCRVSLLPEYRCVCAQGPVDTHRTLAGPVSCSRDTDGLKVVGAFVVGVLTAGVFVPPVEFDDIELVWSGAAL